MFFIDFDDTLFDTQSFIEARRKAAHVLGVTPELWKTTYAAARINENGHMVYSDKAHAIILSQHGFSYDEIFAAFKKTTEECRQWLFPDAIDFLEALKKYHEPLILLSLGDSDFQEAKVRACGIHDYFDRVFMIPDSKARVISELASGAHIDGWLINDKINETKEIIAEHPAIRPILKVSSKFPLPDYEASGLPFFLKLNEIAKFIQNMNITNEKNTGVVILAAGLGKRMQSTTLKVMHLLHDKPLIDYAVNTVEKTELGRKPTVVVCSDDPAVQNYLGDRADYVVQIERLGTGHAVSMAETNLRGNVDAILVLYGDMPFVSSDSIRKLVAEHMKRDNVITLMTVSVPDFLDWRAGLYSYGRIIRGDDRTIVRIVEKKDASADELAINELNPGIYCFKSEWLWDNLKKIKNNNAQKEYYLTDLIQCAIEQGEKISSIAIETREAIGINSPDDLRSAENLI